MEEQAKKNDPGFGVEIRSGGRATVVDTPRQEARPEKSSAPTSLGAQRKARNRSLGLAATALIVLFIAALVGWQWWTTRVPAGVLARVNGEDIRLEQVDREILLTRMLAALITGQEPDPLPGRSSMLESIIERRIKAQDATRAGVVVTDEDMNQEVKAMLDRNQLKEADLDTALAGYGMQLSDLYNGLRDTVQINRYIGQYVVSGATSKEEQLQKINDWETQLNTTSKVDRFSSPDSENAPRMGSVAPDFELALLKPDAATASDGLALTPGPTPVLGTDYMNLSSLKGRPVILNFWATWCQPCRIELPELQAAFAKYQTADPGPGPGLQVLGILVDSDATTALAFQKEFGLTFPVLTDDGGLVKDQYRIGPIPTSYFIDRNGVIKYVKIGMLEAKELDDKIKLIQ